MKHRKPPLLCLVVMTAVSSTLCSCMSPVRKTTSERYGVSADKLPLIGGRWRNTPKNKNAPTLWEELTSDWSRRTYGRPSFREPIVELEMLDNRTLSATLLMGGMKMETRTFKVEQRESWLDLSTQHIAHPLLWYVVWGWRTREIAVGIDRNDDLWVNTIGNGSLMILILPTPIGGGGGPGTVSLYERAEVISGDSEKHVPSEPLGSTLETANSEGGETAAP